MFLIKNNYETMKYDVKRKREIKESWARKHFKN